MPKNKIVVLSDIHIGTNAQTVWYQQKYHEPYLLAVLQWIITHQSEIKELVLLGDIVDFWTYPAEEKPPSFDDIINANPRIFGDNGVNGKLSEVLVALEGKVTYVRGNHDMNISQEDLNKIKNTENEDYTIKLSTEDIYYPIGSDKRIAYTHGHIFTMFNAPCYSSDSDIAPLPIGHFITRAIASWNKKRFAEKLNATVAEEEDSGEPGFGAKLGSFISSIETKISSLLQDSLMYASYNQESKKEVWNKFLSLSGSILDIMAKLADLNDNSIIQLPSGGETQFSYVKQIYTNLFSEWEKDDNFLTAYKALMADYDGSYMGWFAQKLALQVGAELVVMGHTHKPISGLSNSLIQYVNSGFNCPSIKDMASELPQKLWKEPKTPTFITINTESDLKVNVMQVIYNKFTYDILVCSKDRAPKDQVVTDLGVNRDFSCYVIIDNLAGSQLKREKILPEPVHGYYVVEPPETIEHGKIVKFWLQDYPGTFGAEGLVRYINQTTKELITLKYGCPFVAKNYCDGTQLFKTKSCDDREWVENGVQKSGHPFFVRFIMPDRSTMNNYD